MVADRRRKLAAASRMQHFPLATFLASSMRHDRVSHSAAAALTLARSAKRSPRQPLIAVQVEEKNRSKGT